MLITSDKIKEESILKQNYVSEIANVLHWINLQEEIDSQIDKPYLKIWEKEKVMAIFCNDELWQFINKLESLDEQSFTIGKFGKLYIELKKLLKKGFIRDGGKTIRE